MILAGRNLESIFKAFWGREWVTSAAEALGCHPDTVRRWAANETSPPVNRCAQIRRALDQRIAELQAIREQIR